MTPAAAKRVHDLRDALPVARRLARLFEPVCERLEVAGSIRRHRARIGDVEIVAIPRWEERGPQGQAPLEGPPPEVARVNLLAELIEGDGRIETRRRRRDPHHGTLWVPGPLDPDGRAWRLHLPVSALDVDVYLAGPDNYGLTLMIRTGPGTDAAGNPREGFGAGMLRRWKEVSGGGYSEHGMLHDARGQHVPTPDEADVFALCRVRWIDPTARLGAADVRAHAL